MSLTDIATSVQLSTGAKDDEDNEEDDKPVLPQVSSKAVIQALAQVHAFLMQQGKSTASSKALQQIETKRDSITWKQPSSPVTKKFKVQRPAAKVMATVFWDAKGVILRDILPQGQCINTARYCSTLDRLKEAIRRKRPGLLRRGVVLQHDNATAHSANLTQQWLQRNCWEIFPPPAHSPDLAPTDFHLFGPLKRHLGGMAFETEDDLISELRNWFDNLDVDFFRVRINSLLSRWQKRIDLHGDYIEK
ncbi:histone-lysine N-methyltransferase SETMAR [Plakobranchus ocellatus]|uniref:Histone-lysine N-methyltransferase SETMAR n=1 Tax=Plakobranchus ocellatus TaxID=259542 RepID=A0AAV3YZU4_9GAST|nr:histone-lysine N-methyltransferase SETMAR [Plakobranchus ocellatus]